MKIRHFMINELLLNTTLLFGILKSSCKFKNIDIFFQSILIYSLNRARTIRRTPYLAKGQYDGISVFDTKKISEAWLD